jgi:Mg/Co/Ni transporter MgtE
MEPPISVAAHEQTATIATLRQHFGDSPVPVVDSDGYLLGTIPQAPATNAKGTNAGPLS